MRSKVTQLLGPMFSAPGSKLSTENSQLFQSYLGRYTLLTIVHVHVVQCGLYMYIVHIHVVHYNQEYILHVVLYMFMHSCIYIHVHVYTCTCTYFNSLCRCQDYSPSIRLEVVKGCKSLLLNHPQLRDELTG